MKRALMVVGMLTICAGTCSGNMFTVDCTGGGDFTNLPAAVQVATADDTVLVAPCVYEVTAGYPPYVPGYPIHLSGDAPTIMSSGGAEITIVEGDGTLSAFDVQDDCRVVLRGLTIRNVNWPIEVADTGAGGTWRIHDNTFEDCGHAVIATYGGGGISGNTIRNTPGNGLRLEYFNGPISGNEISYCGGNGITGITGEGGLVSGNHVHHNTGWGISLGIYTRATDNIVEYNGTGIAAGCVSLSFNDFSGNIIRHNGVGFLQRYWVPANVHGNDIFDNTEYDFALDSEYTGPDVNATENWWGTTDPDEIAAGILDILDDPSLFARVIFDPWCDAPGCDPGTPVESLTWGTIKALYR